jgi:predicted negative regulator of RcsB-dependent stress response
MKQWFKENPKSVLIIGFVLLIAIGLISYNLYMYFVPGNVSDYNSCMKKRDSQQVCPIVPPCECTYNGIKYIQK